MTAYGDGLYGQGYYGIGGPAGDGPVAHASSLLDEHIGAQAFVVTLGGVEVPVTGAGGITIRHGRSSTDQQPDAGTCTVTVMSDVLDALPTLGQELRVELGPDAADWLLVTSPLWSAVKTRFVGDVTDITVRPKAGIDGPSFVSITAVSPRARLGRVLLGDAPWPVELDGARAGRILALAALEADLDLGTIDAGRVNVRARDVDSQPALALLDQLAVDTGGILAESRAGEMLWHDAEHRRALTPSVTLDAGNVLAPTSTSQNLGGVVNDLTVAYGAEPQATVRVTDEDSVVAYGLFAASIATQLADEDAAESYARTNIARRSEPRWSTPGLTVDLLRTVDVDTAAALLELEFAGLLAVDGFPASGPFAAADLWVEGWTETISRRGWRLALDVSDYQLTGPPLRWSDLPAGLQWADVAPDLTWLDARTVDDLT